MKKIFSLMLLTALCVCITSCSDDDDDTPKVQTSCALKVGETFDLDFKGEWITSNPFVATINHDGIITAERMGTARVLLNKYDLYCDVTVTPGYTLYDEPITEWGISKNSLIEKRGMPDVADGDAIGYITNNEALPMEIYSFEEYRLTGSILMGDAIYKESIVKHLNQRYKYIETYEGIMIYIDAETPANTKSLIGLSCESGLAMLMYIESNISRSDVFNTDFINKIKAQVKAQISKR